MKLQDWRWGPPILRYIKIDQGREINFVSLGAEEMVYIRAYSENGFDRYAFRFPYSTNPSIHASWILLLHMVMPR